MSGELGREDLQHRGLGGDLVGEVLEGNSGVIPALRPQGSESNLTIRWWGPEEASAAHGFKEGWGGPNRRRQAGPSPCPSLFCGLRFPNWGMSLRDKWWASVVDRDSKRSGFVVGTLIMLFALSLVSMWGSRVTSESCSIRPLAPARLHLFRGDARIRIPWRQHHPRSHCG